MGNGLNFHPEATAPQPHLRLAIRPHTERPFCVRGHHEVQIGRYHNTARDASRAVRAYCRRGCYAATVRIFTADGQFWCEDELALDGTVKRTVPEGRQGIVPPDEWPD